MYGYTVLYHAGGTVGNPYTVSASIPTLECILHYSSIVSEHYLNMTGNFSAFLVSNTSLLYGCTVRTIGSQYCMYHHHCIDGQHCISVHYCMDDQGSVYGVLYGVSYMGCPIWYHSPSHTSHFSPPRWSISPCGQSRQACGQIR